MKKAYFNYSAMEEALSTANQRVLYDMYVPCHQDLMLYCLGKFQDPELAKDAASETLQRLLEHPEPQEINNLRAWLLTVAKNVCLTTINTRNRRSGILDSVTMWLSKKQQPEVELEMNSTYIQEMCRAILDQRDYQIWEYVYQGYDDEEIGKMIGMNPKTVANRKSIIKKRLKNHLRM